MPLTVANAVTCAEAYWADSTGGSNTSIMEVNYGTSEGLDGHATRAEVDAVAGSLKTESDVEGIVLDWVTCYNSERLHSTLGNIPPEEYGQIYYAQNHGPSTGDAANTAA